MKGGTSQLLRESKTFTGTREVDGKIEEFEYDKLMSLHETLGGKLKGRGKGFETSNLNWVNQFDKEGGSIWSDWQDAFAPTDTGLPQPLGK